MNLDNLSDKMRKEIEQRCAAIRAYNNVTYSYALALALQEMRKEAAVSAKKAVREASWSGFAQEPMTKLLDLVLLLSAEIE